MVLLLAVARARLPSRLEPQGSAESSKIERRRWRPSPLTSPSPGGSGRAQRRRRRSGAICKSQCLHRVALSLPRQLETTPVSEVVSALCGSRISAHPPAHHDLGRLALITQVVRNGSFARVLRTRIATHLPGIHVSGLDIEYSSLVVGGQRDPTGKRRV